MDCLHPRWRFPNPLPRHGSNCPDCGERYIKPMWVLRSDPEDIELVRAVFEIMALRCLALDGEITPYAATKESNRIARLAGLPELEEAHIGGHITSIIPRKREPSP